MEEETVEDPKENRKLTRNQKRKSEMVVSTNSVSTVSYSK